MLQVAIDWSCSRSWDGENRSNDLIGHDHYDFVMAIRCNKGWESLEISKSQRGGWSTSWCVDHPWRRVTRQPTTPFITRHRLNGRKHATYSPRYYHGGSRGNFGTWHGWEIVSLRGFCLDCWFRSREKWWLLTKTWLPAKKKTCDCTYSVI